MNQVYGFTKEKELLINNYHTKSLANSIIFSGQKGIGKNTFIFNLLKEIFKSSVNKSAWPIVNNNALSAIFVLKKSTCVAYIMILYGE